MMKKYKISVMGLGKLGLPLVAAVASKGHQVLGYDVLSEKIDAFQKGVFFFELSLEELLQEYSENIRFSNQIESCVDSEIIFVVVPTPSKEDGSFSVDFIRLAFENLGKELKKSEKFCVISLVSTVLPGDTAKLIETLEASSGKKCGVDFGVAYNRLSLL